METQKIPDSQSNLEEEKMELEKSTFLTSDYTTKLQSSRQYFVLAQKQKYRSMEPNRKSRDKSTHPWTPVFNKLDKNIQ